MASQIEPIEITALDESGIPVTGATNLAVKLRRASDNLYYDWSDDTFKLPGDVVLLEQLMAEVSAAYSPGEYHLASTNHPTGFDPNKITNPAPASDVLVITVIQTEGPQTVANMPQLGEIRINLPADGQLVVW